MQRTVLTDVPLPAWASLVIGNLLMVGGALAMALPDQAASWLGSTPSTGDALFMMLAGVVVELPFALAVIRNARRLQAEAADKDN